MLEVLIRDGVQFHYFGGVGQVPVNANEAKKARARRRKPTLLATRKANGKRVGIKHYEHLNARYRMTWRGNLYELPN